MTVDQLRTGAELRRAIRDDQVVPFFQPLVEVRSGKIYGFELLARWLHPERGLVNPNEFVPLAERLGIINELTEAVLLQAFQAARLYEDLRLAVNVSPIQLRDRSLPGRIQWAAKRGCFPVHRLTIEITESSLIDNLTVAACIATDLKQMGVKLALDDFGTGYSSLCNLQALPFDEIKVDRSFVGTMIRNRDSRKIVAAVIGLGQSLGLTTVAEGIESRAQAEMLQWLGCDVGQGWLYGPPLPVKDLEDVLATPMHIAGASVAGTSLSLPISSHEVTPVVQKAESNAIYEGAPIGLCFLDRALRYVSANERLADMLGVPVSQRLGRRFGEVFPDLALSCEPFLRRALAGESIHGLELLRPSPKRPAEFTTLLFSYHPARDEAGEIIGISVAAIDITEHRRVQAALLELRQQHCQILELKRFFLWTTDSSGIAVEAQSDGVPMTIMSAEQIRHTQWLSAFHAGDLGSAIRGILHSARTGDPIDLEHRIRDHSGEWRWFRSRGQAQRNPSGKVVRWCGISEDIHEYKLVSDKLRECQGRLRNFEA
jgi:EAL domain-containing protein (putative c-di-GMP-specific phosphodiesterase class I)